MTGDRHDALLDRDWGDVWESLPEAPPQVPRPKTAQITLRLPGTMVGRLRRVAAARSLPYHALARSWLVDGLRQSEAVEGGSFDEPQAEQLNIKVDQETLDGLKLRAGELRRPYHRVARQWIEGALNREEESLGFSAAAANRLALKDLMVLLLHSADKHGHEMVHGMTRLQKLLFVVEQYVQPDSSGFYAYNFGPFDDQVHDAADALGLDGLLEGEQAVTKEPPSFESMMATVVERSGPRRTGDADDFVLNEQGHAAAERLRRSSKAYEQLYLHINRIRQEWDTPDLVPRVYDTWPEYAKRSVIKDKVTRRSERRQTREP